VGRISSPSSAPNPGRIERHRSWARHRAWGDEGAWRLRRRHQRTRPGTTFTLYFHASRRGTCRCSAYTDAVALGRPTILLVDDSPILLRTGRRVLEHLGYQVETLESGKEAYQRFVRAAATGRSPCDLVILDMSLLEERDGLEIFELIRQLFPSQRALLVSGHAPNNRVQAAMERGLGWLGKPYTMESLARRSRGR